MVLIEKFNISPIIKNIRANSAIITAIGRLTIGLRSTISIPSRTPKPAGVIRTRKPIIQLMTNIPVNEASELSGSDTKAKHRK